MKWKSRTVSSGFASLRRRRDSVHRLRDQSLIERWLLGTAFLLISVPCSAADNIPPVDMGGTPHVYGAPMYGGPAYGGPALSAYRGYGGPVYGPVYGGPVLPALPA